MASLMPTLLDLDDFSRLDFPPPALFPEPSPRCTTSAMRPPVPPPFPSHHHFSAAQPSHPSAPPALDLISQNPFAPPLDNPPTSLPADFSFAPRFDFPASSAALTTTAATSSGLTAAYTNLPQHYLPQHYEAPLLARPLAPAGTATGDPAAAADPAAAFDATFADAAVFTVPLTSADASAAATTALHPAAAASFLPTSAAAAAGSVSLSASSTGGAGPAVASAAPTGAPRKRRSVPAGAVSKDKLEERRRKNRESSSRCYYNRKRQIEQVERTLMEHKRRAIALYAQELELRNENARLKKELVMRNIRIPATMLTTTRTEPFSRPPVSHLQR